ncbi:MAG: hypothetical protein GXP40_11415 [Chloroflexi bacterium]|nr:hypothetical protein [Chloroflexota bacterium]
MFRRLVAVYGFLFIGFAACMPSPPAPSQPTLLYMRGGALVTHPWPGAGETSVPLAIPPECSLWSLHSAPSGSAPAIELACPGGTAVVLVEPGGGEMRLLIDEPGVDSHFLAWGADGRSLYLKIDTMGDPRILRVDAASGKTKSLPLPGTTYDLSVLPDGRMIYSLTRGLGFGSETWLADSKGRPLWRLLAAPAHIVAFARPSPDGERIAYILMPDSQTPFTVGELWVADAEGQEPRFLAEADAGHGFAPAWSPDGSQIAFVVRENPDDPLADQYPDKLVSNLYRVAVETGQIFPVTQFEAAIVGAPLWSADGASLFFDVMANGKMDIWAYDVTTRGLAQVTETGRVCCPAWRGK